MKEHMTLDASPSTDLWSTLADDLSYYDAICELVDNAIDNAKRTNQDDLGIDIRYYSDSDPAGERLVIKDNSGGVPSDNLEALIKMGESGLKQANGSIGVYGLGLKRAFTKLGSNTEILTHETNSDYTVKIPLQDGWNERDSLEVTSYRIDDDEQESIARGMTKLTFHNPTFDFGNTRNELEDRLSKTYDKYLQEGVTDIELSLTLHEDNVRPPKQPDWSYNPFGLHPRVYEGVEIDPDIADLDKPVELSITVGLIREDSELAGTDIFCQNRKIVHSDTTQRGGFGNWSSGYLGNYNREVHFKMILEFHTTGDKQSLPWNSSKSDVDITSPVFTAAIKEARKVAQPYKKIRDDIPISFIEPYGPNDAMSYNNGKKQMCKKYLQTNEYPQDEKCDLDDAKDFIGRVKALADCHARFGIICENSVTKKRVRKGYRKQVEVAFEWDKEELTELNLEPTQLSTDNCDEKYRELKMWAEKDAEAGVYDNSLEKWQEPLYKRSLIQEGVDLEALEETKVLDREAVTPEEETQSQHDIGSEQQNHSSINYREYKVRIPRYLSDQMYDSFDLGANPTADEVETQIEEFLKSVIRMNANN